MRCANWLAIVILCASFDAFSDPPATTQVVDTELQDVSAELAKILKKHKLPGMVVIVTKGDAIIASGAAGVRKSGVDTNISIHDQFHIGSCTKAITATLCAILVEEGKLSWDTTIEQVFPEIVPRIDKAYRVVTLEQLLTHRSGLPEDRKPTEILQTIRDFQGSLPEARRFWMIDSLSKPPAAATGTRHQYSNAGYIIAGAMCEKVTGFSWENLMTARIFKPLGMATAGFGAPGRAGKLDQPRGHTMMNIGIEPGDIADNPAALGPAGTVHCSLPDWAKFVAAHLTRNKLVAPETYAKLQTPVTDPQIPYAMGWIVTDRDWADGEALTHSGSNGFWYAVVWASIRKEMSVLIVTNQAGPAVPKACDDAAALMIKRFIAPAAAVTK